MREATIQRIESLTPILKADRIVMATMEGLGWACVVGKDDFQVGDPCVYFTIDSLLPETPWSAFLKGNLNIKTMRFKGALSQGLALPVSILMGNLLDGSPITCTPKNKEGIILVMQTGFEQNCPVGTDVTDILGVKHYEKPVPEGLIGDPKGGFPSHTAKTDEALLQNILGILKILEGEEVYVSVKCNGTSTTFSMLEGDLDICGRTWSMKEFYQLEGKHPVQDTNWKMYRKYPGIEQALKDYDCISIQAELVGPGIRKNQMGLKELEIRVFNVWDIRKARYFGFPEIQEFCLKYHLPMVPVLYITTPHPADQGGTQTPTMSGPMLTLAYWLELAKGNYEGTDNRQEGLVVRACKPRYILEVKNRASFKVLNNDFLLHDDEE